MSSVPSPAYSAKEEWINSLSHGIGLVAAVVGLVFILLRAQDPLAITVSAIYGTTLILMF